MDLKELKTTLSKHYKATNQFHWLSENQIIVLPDDEVWRSMIERNPTVVKEVKKANSSTALAINYFELYAKLTGIRVDYEIEVAIPLILPKGKGHYAMIDAFYKDNGTYYYIESKFLEPYYSETHEISASYFVEKYYETEEIASKWIELFKKVQEMINDGEFKYFDINQMLKHLLAIYRTKPNLSVVLKNLIWKPEKTFYNYIDSNISVSYLQKRVESLSKEIKIAAELMNTFVKEELHWENCSIKILFYNDDLKAVSSHHEYKTFIDKYLFLK